MRIFEHNKRIVNVMLEQNQYRNRLRVILADKEITNHWLAEHMGVTDMTISRWSTNKVQPSMSQFVTISKLLDVELKDLIEDHE